MISQYDSIRDFGGQEVSQFVSTMLPHRRQGSEEQFSFSGTTDEQREPPKDPKSMEYSTWAEKIKGKYNYFGKPEDVKFGAWARDRSGTPSPEHWKDEGSPVHDRHISNGSRAETIAKFRQELLNSVRDVPENSYELSLIDIVESPKIAEPVKETASEVTSEEESNNNIDNNGKKKKRKEKGVKGMMRRVSRSESMDSGGLMLKMFIPRMPAALGGRRQGLSKSGKVSPAKPVSLDGDKVGAAEKKRTEGEWWSNEFGEMVSSTSSSNSTSSSTSTSHSSRSSRLIGSCYPFVGHKGKSMVVED